jgi:hypothetical protein
VDVGTGDMDGACDTVGSKVGSNVHELSVDVSSKACHCTSVPCRPSSSALAASSKLRRLAVTGDGVGFNVGCNVGISDGSAVGCKLGASDGIKVGNDVG